MGKPEWVGAYPRDLGPSDGSASWEKGKDKEEWVGGDRNTVPSYEKNEKLGGSQSGSGSVQKIENVESAQEVQRPKLSRTKRLWRHYKRHWFLYGVLGVISLAIGLSILFLVIFPAIAQRLVDDADLPIHAAMIMNPEENSVTYSMTASLKVPKPFTVHIDPTVLELYRPETKPHRIPYIKVELPKLKLHGNATVTVEGQQATILDKEQFTQFLAYAVYNEEFEMSAYGKTTAYLGKLKAHITLDKTIKLKGLNMLKGFSIDSAQVVLPPEEDGANLVGNLTLPNPSLVTFELGNVTLNMKVGDLILGHANISNVQLKPGNNSVYTRGIIDIKTAIQNLEPIINAEAASLKKGMVSISASGNSTIFNGRHIDYFEKVLNNLTITAEMPITDIIFDSLGGLLGDLGGGLGSLLNGLNVTNLLNLFSPS